MNSIVDQLKGTVIVSCQARAGEPFNQPHFIAEFAKSAAYGGASALRINGVDNIRAVKAVVDLPVIGIKKRVIEGSEVYITPTWSDVNEVIESGAEIVALDGTLQKRLDGESFESLVAYCHQQKRLVLADIATEEDAEFALSCGADLLATTLSGYTKATKGNSIPDYCLLETLARRYSQPVFLEGGITSPVQVREAFNLGAYGVIIGKAITMPHFITRQFIDAAQG